MMLLMDQGRYLRSSLIVVVVERFVRYLWRVLDGEAQLAEVASELFDALIVALYSVRRKL